MCPFRARGDLLAKNEDGTYSLTGKGKVASQLLLTFPENNENLYKEWLKANIMSKKPNYLFGAAISCLLALLSLGILAALNEVNIRTFIFPWLFFINGIFSLVWHLRKKKKNLQKRKQTPPLASFEYVKGIASWDLFGGSWQDFNLNYESSSLIYRICFPVWDGNQIEHDPVYVGYILSTTDGSRGSEFPSLLALSVLVGVATAASLLFFIVRKRKRRVEKQLI